MGLTGQTKIAASMVVAPEDTLSLSVCHASSSLPNAQVETSARSDDSSPAPCSACFGRGYIYGPYNAYPITEAQEQPEILNCPVCRGTGKKPNKALCLQPDSGDKK